MPGFQIANKKNTSPKITALYYYFKIILGSLLLPSHTSFIFPESITNTTSLTVILVSAILVERICKQKNIIVTVKSKDYID